MESMQRALALGIAAPVAAATVLFWLLWRAKPEEARVRHVATAIGLPVLFASAWVFGIERPSFPPTSGADWVLPIALAGGLIAVAACFVRGGAADTTLWILRALLVAGGTAIVARNRIANGWPAAEAAAWIAGATAAGLAAWWALDRAGRESGGAAPILVVLAVASSSVAAVLTGHISAALTPAVLCAVIGPAFLVALRRPAISMGPGIGFGAAFLAGNWFATSVLGETPWLSNLLAAVSVVAVGATSGGRFAGWKGNLLRGGIVAAPGIAGVGWALLNQPGPGEY
ncbi:hypothetical protein PHYC_03300 [Phycisphaerales bacterium]|nr:hypothetical protein PHYC_03300 [Phycisphaerales bacterium]